MLTQNQADRLIQLLKEAVQTEMFVWERDKRQDELVVAVEDKKIQFVLSLKRNPFEFRLHFRTKDRNIGLVRLDNAHYHANPDGTEIHNKPHLHIFREGEGLNWAEPVDWCDFSDPVATLERFLEIIRTRFPSGVLLDML